MLTLSSAVLTVPLAEVGEMARRKTFSNSEDGTVSRLIELLDSELSPKYVDKEMRAECLRDEIATAEEDDT